MRGVVLVVRGRGCREVRGVACERAEGVRGLEECQEWRRGDWIWNFG